MAYQAAFNSSMTRYLPAMEKRTLAGLREQVKQRRHQLLERAESAAEEGRKLTAEGPQDTADQASLSTSREQLFRQVSQNRQEVVLLESVLRRMDDGSFGSCRRCGDEIDLRRLKALPWATYCLECQASIEQEGKLLRTAS